MGTKALLAIAALVVFVETAQEVWWLRSSQGYGPGSRSLS